MSGNYQLISTPAELTPLLDLLTEPTMLALDTEADSMHHYREKLCLIQLSVAGQQFIVDPLAPELDLAPLFARLAPHTLILHGADYDLRLLHRFHGFRPAAVFDTMIAAQLLGRPQIGLASLVQHYCEVTLTKDNQRADWAERPLGDELLAYAAEDTRYLHAIVEKMQAELAERGRLEWHSEACARAVANALAPRPERDLEESWRIKGGKHLRGRAAAMLRESWKWREELARRLDRPPFKVAPSELLLKYAVWAEANPQASYHQAPPRPAWLRGSRLRAFEEALTAALGLPAGDWPRAPEPAAKGLRLTRAEEMLLARLLQARDRRAHELGLDPGVLGPRDLIKGLLRHKPATAAAMREITPLMQWQAECLAPVLIPLLHHPDAADAEAQPVAAE